VKGGDARVSRLTALKEIGNGPRLHRDGLVIRKIFPMTFSFFLLVNCD